jgi:hypothetical protein
MNITHNMLCNWRPTENIGQQYRCANCNNIVTITDDNQEPPQMICRSLLPINGGASDGLLSKRQLTSMLDINHQNNTNMCSETEINNRHSICQGCEFFRLSTCSQCGCAITRDKTYASKLIFKNESCPVGKW